MKGRNICLQSRKHQKKHTRIISYLQLWTNSPCLFDKPPNFRVTAFLGKKQPAQFLPRTGGKQFSSPGDELLGLWRWVFFVFFQRLFPEGPTKNRGLKRKWDTTNMVGCLNDVHQLLSDLNVGLKWCSPTIECSPIHFFSQDWISPEIWAGPEISEVIGIHPWALWWAVASSSLGAASLEVFVSGRTCSDDFQGNFGWFLGSHTWTLVGGWNWHDMILIFERWQGWFCWEIRGVRCVRTRGDYHRFSEDISDSRFRDIFRSIDDGFKFWTPKIISSRAQE